jgi:hypothetical protein
LVGVGLIVAALIVGENQLASDNGGSAITLSPGAAHAFDPPPEGDSEEHSSEAGLAVDGNPTGTSWPTETYQTDDINGKPGVGIYVDAGKPVKASAMDVRASASGWDAEVRAAPSQDSAPKTLDGWRVVGSGSDLGTHAKIRVEGGGESRFYLLWLTKLPQTDGGYNLEISDIKLLS